MFLASAWGDTLNRPDLISISHFLFPCWLCLQSVSGFDTPLVTPFPPGAVQPTAPFYLGHCSSLLAGLLASPLLHHGPFFHSSWSNHLKMKARWWQTCALIPWVCVGKSCRNGIPQTAWHTQPTSFLAVVEAGSPRWWCWQFWFLPKLLSLTCGPHVVFSLSTCISGIASCVQISSS